ncbi:MAG: hypothetical protein R2940_15290 [Syntrophotaleaceae bacterium]
MKKKSRKKARRPLVRFALWSAVFLVLVVAADQALLHLDADRPLIRNFQECYRDFRTRLLGGRPSPMPVPRPTRPSSGPVPCEKERNRTVEAILEQSSKDRKTSYLYVDRQGVLQFADSLDEVPPAYRRSAQALEE